MNYVIDYDLFSTILLFVMIVANISMPFKNKFLRKNYMAMEIVVFLSCIFDMASSILIEQASDDTFLYILTYVATQLYMMIHVCAPLLMSIYIYYCIMEKAPGRNLFIKMILPMAICEIILFTNPFTGLAFTYKDGVYSRGPLLLLNYALTSTYFIALIVFLFLYRKKSNVYVRISATFYLSINVFTIVMQYFFPQYLLECAGMTATLLVVHYCIQSRDMIEQAILGESEIAKAANEANSAKTEFLASVSHEIRTPLNTMMGMNQMILSEATSLKTKQYAQNVDNAGKILLSLVDDIIDFSKMENGTLVIENSEYSIKALIQGICSEINALCQQKNLEFHVIVEHKMPSELIGDAKRLRETMINLLTNAVKYTENGYVELKVGYKRINAKELSLEVFVKDSGIGINEENLEKLSSIFMRFNHENNRNIEGLGLGLNITSQILKQMDSCLEVKSVEGEGSVFSYSVVQGISDNTSVGDVDWFKPLVISEEDEDSFIAPNAKVLVVDDNDMNLQVMRNLMSFNKVKTVTVENGSEAIKATRKIAFDIIIMDQMMPKMNGKETMDYIKNDALNINSNTPIVLLTANVMPGAREKYIKDGFDEYLTKPVEYKELERTLLNLLPKEKIVLQNYSNN